MAAGLCCFEPVFLRLCTLMRQRTAMCEMRSSGRKKIASWGLSLRGGLAQVRWAWPMGKTEMKVLQNRLEGHQPDHSEFPLRLQEALKLEKANQQPFVIPTLPLARRQLLSLGPFQMAVYLPCMMKESFEVSRCPFKKHF